MATSNLIFGEQEDINVKHGDYFDGHTFTITDSNGDAYTFPDGVSTVDIKIYIYNGGSQVGDTLDIAGGELARTDNVITWTSTFVSWDSGSITIPGYKYYYEMTLVTVTGSKHKTITYGYITII